MWLVLCERGDADALWAARGLARRALAPLEVVTTEELAAARWEHRLGADGATVEIELADGRAIRSDELCGALNRLVRPPGLGRVTPADREYAREEVHAFFLSWLAALPGVVGRPTPDGLCGPWLHRSEWLALAARAGLPTPPYRRTSNQLDDAGPPAGSTVIVVGSKALGPPDARALATACGRLARLAGADLLGVELDRDGAFAGATPLPALRPGGERLLDLLAAELRG